jgi:hypothetical protein
MEGCAHDFLYHIEGSKSGGVNNKQPVFFCVKIDFPFLGIIFPNDTISGKRFGLDCCGLILVNFVFFQIDKVEVVFPKSLQMADIFITDGVALAKSRTLKLAGTDFRDIMG